MKRPSLSAVLIITAAIIAAASASACSQKPKPFALQRADMVKYQLKQRGITDPAILNAFMSVPREEYVLPSFRDHTYDDVEAPSGFGQSLDRPYENAVMLRALVLKPTDRVLEVGTGSGYLSSLMSRIARDVYTIEIEGPIAQDATERVRRLGYENVHVKQGDGFLGWPEYAPFNAIVMTCSPPELPKPLVEQLAEGGRIVLPLGGTEKFQELVMYEKKEGKLIGPRPLAPTEFVPMKGKILDKN
ncbi:MAG: protein-L-isoaspartate(D-aspartate) O-methyltransferase [bacterium]